MSEERGSTDGQHAGVDRPHDGVSDLDQTVRLNRRQLAASPEQNGEITPSIARDDRTTSQPSSASAAGTFNDARGAWEMVGPDELDRCMALAPAGGWTPLADVREYTDLSDRIEASRRALHDLEGQRADAVANLENELRAVVDTHIGRELSRLERAGHSAFQALQQSVTQHVVDVAEVILRRELVGATEMGGLVREALAGRDSPPTGVRIGDRSAVDKPAWVDVRAVWDSELEPGDVIVEFEDGTLDFRVQTLLELASKAIGASEGEEP